MGKKNTARKLRRNPKLVEQLMSEAGPSQIPGDQYKAAADSLGELLAWDRTHPPETDSG